MHIFTKRTCSNQQPSVLFQTHSVSDEAAVSSAHITAVLDAGTALQSVADTNMTLHFFSNVIPTGAWCGERVSDQHHVKCCRQTLLCNTVIPTVMQHVGIGGATSPIMPFSNILVLLCTYTQAVALQMDLTSTCDVQTSRCFSVLLLKLLHRERTVNYMLMATAHGCCDRRTGARGHRQL